MTDPARPRGDRSEHIRIAIRDVAAAMFVDKGYAATGVRDIAQAAGVDAAIVIRHFGSKEALFLKTVTFPDSWRQALDGPVDGLGRSIVTRVLEGGEHGLAVWAALMRASDRPDVGKVFRDGFTLLFAEQIAKRLDVDDAQLRAHLFAAQLEGLLSALSIRGDVVLLALPADQLIETYGDVLQATLTGSSTVARS